MAAVYMTVEGRSTDTTEAIAESRALLGAESTKDWCDGYQIQFLDFPFTDTDATFADHLVVVKDVRPQLTVAPDVEGGRTLPEVVNMADRLSQYSQDIIIVPKDCHPSEVPNRFRVGVTAADFGSSAPWSVWEYRDCGPVHILGGGPARQLELAHYLNVASVDTSSLNLVARFGYWDGGTVDAPEEWDYRRRLTESLDNYADAWA
jgi:hypothetical protein